LVSVNSTTSHFAKLFGSAPFWLAGKISMVFYLIHVPIVRCISRVYPDTSYEIKLASTVILSLVIHFAIEVPSNLFIRRRFDLYQKKLINKP
jgi:peptidoglycan/LPS O-acetylase OafA/YrhL